jgi:hypothetical protein
MTKPDGVLGITVMFLLLNRGFEVEVANVALLDFSKVIGTSSLYIIWDFNVGSKVLLRMF